VRVKSEAGITTKALSVAARVLGGIERLEVEEGTAGSFKASLEWRLPRRL